MRKAGRIVLFSILSLIVLVVILFFLIYIPAVQRGVLNIVDRQLQRVEKNLTYDVFRLRFPLDLEIENMTVTKTKGDTLLHISELILDLDFNEIFDKRINLTELSLTRFFFVLTKQPQIDLRLNIDHFQVDRVLWELSNNHFSGKRVRLVNADMHLDLLPTQDTVRTSKTINWSFAFEQVELDSVYYAMDLVNVLKLKSGISNGFVSNLLVDLGNTNVNCDSVYLFYSGCDMRLAEDRANDESSSDTTARGDTPWRVNNKVFILENGYYSLEQDTASAFPIRFNHIAIQTKDLFNQGTSVLVDLTHLSAQQPDGLTLENANGKIAFYREQVNVDSFYIKTANSELFVNAHGYGSIADIVKENSIDTRIRGVIGLADLRPFVKLNSLDTGFVYLRADMQLSTRDLNLDVLNLSMPNNFNVELQGKLSDYVNIRKTTGSLSCDVDIMKAEVLNSFLRPRLVLSDSVFVNTDLVFNQGAIDLSMAIKGAMGQIASDGSLNLSDTTYGLHIDINQFELGNLLNNPNLGPISLVVQGYGRGMKLPYISGKYEVDLKEFVFNSYAYENIRLQVEGEDGRYELRMETASKELDLDWLSTIVLNKSNYVLNSKLELRALNLGALKFTENKSVFSGDLNFAGSYSKQKQSVYMIVDSLQVVNEEGDIQKYRPISVQGASGSKGINLGLASGDLSLRFTALESVPELMNTFNRIKDQGRREYLQDIFNTDSLFPLLPTLSLKLDAGSQNGINGLLSNIGMGFNKMKVDVVMAPNVLDVSGHIDKLVYQNFYLDTIALNMKKEAQRLNFEVMLDRYQVQQKERLRFLTDGYIASDLLNIHLKQLLNNQAVNYDIGFLARLKDKKLVVNLDDSLLIIANRKWSVNKGNYFTLFNREVDADIKLFRRGRLVNLYSDNDIQEGIRRLNLQMVNIDIGKLTSSLSFLPNINARLNTDISIYSDARGKGITGNIIVDSLDYQGAFLKHLAMKMDYGTDEENKDKTVDFSVRLDSLKNPVLAGMFKLSDTNEDISLQTTITNFPMKLVNFFVSPDMLQFSGDMSGEVSVAGSMKQPRFNGDVRFEDTKLRIPMIGTAFRLSEDVVRLQDNVIRFSNYNLYAPDKSNLSINGSIDMRELSAPQMNLSFKAQNFQLVDVNQSDSSSVYGKAYSNIDATLSGMMSSLSFIGNIGVLGSTRLNYVIARQNQIQILNRAQGVVQFVSFADTLQNIYLRKPLKFSSTNFSLKLFINIAPTVSFSVQLPGNPDNVALVVGGGDLVFSITTREGIKLYGRYSVASGLVRYSIPIVGTKTFTIKEGSYIEWLGNALDPRIALSAGESVKASVQLQGQSSRLVDFDASINISNSLKQPSILFNISAPNDNAIQTRLNTFSAEERSKQALNLLIYGTYTGPGSVKSGGVDANSALGNFVESELNQWSRRLIKNADLSFGVDTYNQSNVGADNTSTRTDYSYSFSKRFFNDRVNVKVGGSITTDSDPSQGTEENLIDDVEIEYRLTNRRNLYLKAFRRSNYESILEGSVTATGLGIIWRKDFSQWKNIWKRTVVNSNTKK